MSHPVEHNPSKPSVVEFGELILARRPVHNNVATHAVQDHCRRLELRLNFPPASGYDGGDCCQCTCVDTEEYTCGDHGHGGYACLDPSASCVDDDDITVLPEIEYVTYTGRTSSVCFDNVIGDGDCDPANNNEACGEIWLILLDQGTA